MIEGDIADIYLFKLNNGNTINIRHQNDLLLLLIAVASRYLFIYFAQSIK